MKKLLSLLLLMMCVLGGWATEVTYTVTSKTSVSTTGVAPEGSSSTFLNNDIYENAQLREGHKMTLTLNGYTGMKITSITLLMKSNASSGAGYLSVIAGSNTLASIGSPTNGVAFSDNAWNGRYSTSSVYITPTMTNNRYIVMPGENVTIEIGATTNSLYCYSFKISYEQAPPLTISPVGYATFCNAEAVTVPTGVEAYVWDNGLQKGYAAGEVIPANVPVVLKGAAGTYPLTYTTGGTAPASNALRGAATAITAEQMAAIDPDNNYFYCLSLDASHTPGSIGFYWDNATGAAFNLEAGKAYLVLPQGDTSARQFVFDDEATGIQDVGSDRFATFYYTPADVSAYNLAGQRVSPDTSGLVIINGRKFLNK